MFCSIIGSVLNCPNNNFYHSSWPLRHMLHQWLCCPKSLNRQRILQWSRTVECWDLSQTISESWLYLSIPPISQSMLLWVSIVIVGLLNITLSFCIRHKFLSTAWIWIRNFILLDTRLLMMLLAWWALCSSGKHRMSKWQAVQGTLSRMSIITY